MTSALRAQVVDNYGPFFGALSDGVFDVSDGLECRYSFVLIRKPKNATSRPSFVPDVLKVQSRMSDWVAMALAVWPWTTYRTVDHTSFPVLSTESKRAAIAETSAGFSARGGNSFRKSSKPSALRGIASEE